jgi:CRP-like cAMP-binding protein
MDTTHERARRHKDQGQALLVAGKLDGALLQFRQALTAEPGDVSARRRVAEILARLDRRPEAVAEYQHLAGRYAADGQLVQAMAVCKVILSLDPRHAQTQEILAGLYAQRQDRTHWTERLPKSMAGALSQPRPTAPAPAEVPAEEDGVPPPAVEVEIEVAPPEPEELDLDVQELPPTPLFSDLPAEVFVGLLNTVTLRTASGGETVVREGERGDAMFVIAQGELDVVRDLGSDHPRTVATMGPGTFFGEVGLVAEVPRLASVVARGDCELLEVTREMLRGLGERFPGLPALVERFFKERLLANVLRSSPLFQALDAGATRALVDRFCLRTEPAGATLLAQGQPGPGLYLLLRGQCSVTHEEDGRPLARYPDMAEGALFGEISALHGSPATATVRATSDCLLLFLDRQGLAAHLLAHPASASALQQLGAQRLERTRQVQALAGTRAELV